MKLRSTLPVFLIISLLALVLAGCDNGPAPTPPTPTATSWTTQPQVESTLVATDTAQAPAAGSAIASPTGTIVDAVTVTAQATAADTMPTATPVTATSTGDAITALQALEELKGKALAEMPDARLAMLVNSRPAQQKILLGTSLGDPNVNEATPGGLGRNWTLIAVSSSQKRAVAFSLDGSMVDLTAEGTVPDELLANFGSPAASALDLSTMKTEGLTDSDAVVQAVGERAGGDQVGVALLAPDALGIGPLPTPETGDTSPQLVYELFSTDPATQLFVFFDAVTGDVVLDSGT